MSYVVGADFDEHGNLKQFATQVVEGGCDFVLGELEAEAGGEIPWNDEEDLLCS